MRAITVRQPWAWAIVHGGKDVENRTRNIAGSYRGRVAIHAGLSDADNAPDSLWLDAMRDGSTTVLREPGKSLARWQPRGAIIGTVNLWAVHEARPGCCPNGGARPFGSPWAMSDHWHLCLTDPQPFATPIPAVGKLGLWTPNEALLHAMEAA